MGKVLSEGGVSMTHTFNTEIAKIVGLNAAVIFENIVFWLKKNLDNGKHVIDNRVWTYSSVNAMRQFFPYLTDGQIRGALKKLQDENLIEVRQFSGYNRVNWFTANVDAIRKFYQFDLQISANGSADFSDCIIYNNTDNNTDSNTDRDDPEIFELQSEYDNVRLTRNEFDKLCDLVGKEAVIKGLDILEAYKTEKGKQYKSDYRAFRKWVIDRVRNDYPDLINKSERRYATLKDFKEHLVRDLGYVEGSVEFEQTVDDWKSDYNDRPSH